ncbi:MAG: RDD family protein [Dinghuibacter sp.]|nr:RDD family protein [Dinghuibacter sp.]
MTPNNQLHENRGEDILADITETETEAPPGRRFAYVLADIIIELLILFMLYKLLPRDMLINFLESGYIVRLLVIFALTYLYRVSCLFTLGKTLGMLLCRVKYLNAQQQPLSASEKLSAVFQTRRSAIKVYMDNN